MRHIYPQAVRHNFKPGVARILPPQPQSSPRLRGADMHPLGIPRGGNAFAGRYHNANQTPCTNHFAGRHVWTEHVQKGTLLWRQYLYIGGWAGFKHLKWDAEMDHRNGIQGRAYLNLSYHTHVMKHVEAAAPLNQRVAVDTFMQSDIMDMGAYDRAYDTTEREAGSARRQGLHVLTRRYVDMHGPQANGLAQAAQSMFPHIKCVILCWNLHLMALHQLRGHQVEPAHMASHYLRG